MSATYVLVHGGGHGGWCWQRIVPLLTARVVMHLEGAGAEGKRGRSFMASLLGVPLLVLLLGLLAYFVQRVFPSGRVHFGGFKGGTPRDVGLALFTTYLLPFEITSLLILIAIIGAVVLARKEMD